VLVIRERVRAGEVGREGNDSEGEDGVTVRHQVTIESQCRAGIQRWAHGLKSRFFQASTPEWFEVLEVVRSVQQESGAFSSNSPSSRRCTGGPQSLECCFGLTLVFVSSIFFFFELPFA
jgi:hypothetical protein